MLISDILAPHRVAIISAGLSSDEALDQLARLLADAPDVDRVLTALKDRESIASTNLGFGVAIPHARVHGADSHRAALVVSGKDVEFGDAESDPVRLFFGILAPTDSHTAHLETLAGVSRLVQEEGVREALKSAPDPQRAHAIITKAEAQQSTED